jgi:hypothetical protein
MEEMEKIILKKNPYGDTRTAPDDFTYEKFCEATDWHRDDVKRVMTRLGYMTVLAGEKHDWSKKGAYEMEFFTDFKNAKEKGANFVEGTWWPKHVTLERHHLLANCPDDVNLIDVLEMIADCTCAGITRNPNGEVRPIEINDEILNKAVTNTVELIKNMVQLEG